MSTCPHVHICKNFGIVSHWHGVSECAHVHVRVCVHACVCQSEWPHVAILSVKLHLCGHIHGDSRLTHSSRTLFPAYTVQHDCKNKAMPCLQSEWLPSRAAVSFSGKKTNLCTYSPQHPDHKDAICLANIWSSITANLAADNPELEGMTGEHLTLNSDPPMYAAAYSPDELMKSITSSTLLLDHEYEYFFFPVNEQSWFCPKVLEGCWLTSSQMHAPPLFLFFWKKLWSWYLWEGVTTFGTFKSVDYSHRVSTCSRR